MSNDIDRVVNALKSVPEKRLLIIELVNKVPMKLTLEGGREMDYQWLAEHQPEVNLAVAEAKAYGTHTIQAVAALIRLHSSKEGE